MLTLGILGLGEGRSTISAAVKSSKWNLKTICDRSIEVCQQRADEFKVYDYTTEYQDMLDDPEIDAIAIYTPDHLHAEHVKLALLHNKHIICTKPFIDDLSVAKELLALQSQTGKKVLLARVQDFLNLIKSNERILWRAK